MDLTSTVSTYPGATPLAGLPDAWHWSPNPMFNFAAALSADRKHLLEVRVMNNYDEGLVRAILEFARDHSSELLTTEAHLIPLPGFHHPGRTFNTVTATVPQVHDYHAREEPNVHAVTFAIFPGYRCEFSGNETVEEAWGRFKKMLRPTKPDREPVPFLKMRYDNTRTRSYSKGPDRGFSQLATLIRELQLLEDAPGSFVEWENRHGEVWRAGWEGVWKLSGAPGERVVGIDELLAFAQEKVAGDCGG